MKKNTLFGLGLIISSLVLGGCASNGDLVNKKEYDPAPVGKKILWSTSEKRPGWSVTQVNYSDGNKHYFVGSSEKMPTEKTSRSVAEINARAKASKFIETKSSIDERSYEKTNGKLGDTATGSFGLNKKEQITSNTTFSELSVEEWYTVMWEDAKGKEFWQSYVLMSLPTSAYQEAKGINQPQKEVSYEYLDSIGALDNIIAKKEASLAQKPVEGERVVIKKVFSSEDIKEMPTVGEKAAGLTQ